MDFRLLTTLINKLDSCLSNIRINDCPEDFVTTLDRFVNTATQLSDQIKSESLRRQNNVDDSDVVWIPPEEPFISLDDEDHVNPSNVLIPILKKEAEAKPSIEFRCKKLTVTLKRLEKRKEVREKRCVLRLERLDMQKKMELDELQHANTEKTVAEEPLSVNDEEENASVKVSLTTNETIKVTTTKAIGQYTYKDYEKRFSDGCCMQ